MKKFLFLVLLVLIALPVFAAPVAVTVQEVSTTAIIDSSFTRYHFGLITTTDGVIFPNDERTFVILYDSTGGAATGTITKPQATIYIPGYGYQTLSDLTYVLESGASKPNFAIFQVPLRYNVSGKITIAVNQASRLKIAVYRLKEQR